jgi:3-phosphoshikimate 1-carboxyvinyltransferase
MKVSISKSSAAGKVAAPPSKSYTIRALMCAALARGQSFIHKPLEADDTRAAREVLAGLGVNINLLKPGWQVNGGELKPAAGELFCRDSAATLRFMTAMAAVAPGITRLVPGQSLAKRPIQPLLAALQQLGVTCRLENTTVIVEGGRLEGGKVSLPGDISSQYVSALLLIAPLADKGLHINLLNAPRSRPYLAMTIECLKHFGIRVNASPDYIEIKVASQTYQPAGYVVEGDWSQASYLLALGVLAGEVLVTNLSAESLQGDRRILNLLQKMGARFTLRHGSVMVSQSWLRAISVDLADAIDLLPTMAVLAAVADGTSEFTGIARARLKESNRVTALKEELGKMGIRTIEEEDKLSVVGGRPRGAVIDSHGDHRLAMAFGVLGASIGYTTICGADSVTKTYPDFWQVLKDLGCLVTLNVP